MSADLNKNVPLLTIELVPESCWKKNLRSILSKESWDQLRREVYQAAEYRCQICYGQGPRWPVECHEIWHYDDQKKIQSLHGLIALCPLCHKVKHFGHSNNQERVYIAKKHLAAINHWSEAETNSYVENCYKTWQERSQHKWTVNLTWLGKKDFYNPSQTPKEEKFSPVNDVVAAAQLAPAHTQGVFLFWSLIAILLLGAVVRLALFW